MQVVLGSQTLDRSTSAVRQTQSWLRSRQGQAEATPLLFFFGCAGGEGEGLWVLPLHSRLCQKHEVAPVLALLLRQAGVMSLTPCPFHAPRKEISDYGADPQLQHFPE